MIYDVIIIGSGPAGLTAAIYTSRASLSTVVIAGTKWGGQLMQTTEVENFPGFPEGIQGPELMMRMRKQAERFGSRIIDEPATAVDFSKQPFSIHTATTVYTGKSVIVATGADTRWLGVKGEEKLIGRGVSSCAPCDAFFYKGKDVIVVGGGDSAMEEALVLTKFASKVYIMHRGPQFRASKIMQDRVLHHPKIEAIWNSVITEIIGDQKVEKVQIKSQISNDKQIPNMKIIKETEKELVWEMPIGGVFVAIGHNPNTNVFKNILKLDAKGYIAKTYSSKLITLNGQGNFPSMSEIEGVFIAGDVQDYHYRQAITAAGYGCMAALDAEKWLSEI